MRERERKRESTILYVYSVRRIGNKYGQGAEYNPLGCLLLQMVTHHHNQEKQCTVMWLVKRLLESVGCSHIVACLFCRKDKGSASASGADLDVVRPMLKQRAH